MLRVGSAVALVQELRGYLDGFLPSRGGRSLLLLANLQLLLLVLDWC